MVKKMYVQFYIISIYSKSMAHIRKVHEQNSFIFRLYIRVPNFVKIDVLGEKLKMLNIEYEVCIF